MNNSHTCPVEGTHINETTVRVVAFLVVISTTLGILFSSTYVFIFLSYDFFVRGFYKRQWSLLRQAAIQIVNLLGFKAKLIDAGGKKFAVKIGFLFGVVLAISALLELKTAVYLFGFVLIFFAILESVFAYCVGCKVYLWLTFAKHKILRSGDISSEDIIK